MNFEFIHQKVVEVYAKCNINTFPIDCFDILFQYRFTLKTYSEVKETNLELYNSIVNYSDDAFQFGMTIYYNENTHKQRIRFSLMHELGHHILGHTTDSPSNESEANYFAGAILAPSMAIHYAKCKNLNDVSKIFNVSYEAADISFNRYRKWHRHVTYHKMCTSDKMMYSQFYNPKQKCFVWSIKKCSCGKIYYNSNDEHCSQCQQSYEYFKNLDSYLRRISRSYQEPEYIPGFNFSEQQHENNIMRQYDLI